MYRGLAASALLAFLIGLGPAAHGQTVVPPLPVVGPYPVACTNVEQDFARVPPGETADMNQTNSAATTAAAIHP